MNVLFCFMASAHKIIEKQRMQTARKAKWILKVHLTLHADMLKGLGHEIDFIQLEKKVQNLLAFTIPSYKDFI